MKQLRLIILPLILFFFFPTLRAMSSWTSVAEKLQNSTVFIEMSSPGEKGSCSGFVIDEKKGYVLTAGHCDGEKITVDGLQSYKMFKDERKDLMVLRVISGGRPALKLSKTMPDRGDEVASMGFGMGLEQPLFRVGHISSNHLNIEELSGPFVMTDISQVPGMSGGPIVNTAGEVVSIVQRTGDGFGIGVGSDTIRDKVGRYFSAE